MSGLFGAVSQSQQCIDDVFYGTDYLSHMGTEFGGVAIIKDPLEGDSRILRRIHNISQGQFKSKFYEDYHELAGQYGIGVISDKDEQPIFLNTRFGPLAICTAGLVENNKELIDILIADGISFSETTDGHSNSTEIVGKLITQCDSMVKGIQRVFSLIKGSATMLILTREGIYAARDRFGYVPLVIGKRGDSWAVTSETNAFPNLDFTIMRYLEPGEIVLLNKDGLQTLQVGRSAQSQICAFLWIYTGFPASSYEGISVEKVRERCGSFLAIRDTVEADLVSGIPDSGIAHAIGYAMESGIPYRRVLIKYTPGYGRSYTPPTQAIRDKVAKMKLIPVHEIIKGNRIMICDDSIVRGTQFKNFTVTKLKQNGSREIHIRPACPPLMFPCRFCLSTRSIHELAARRAIRALEGYDKADVSEYTDWRSSAYKKMVAWIADDLGVTTLQYQRIEDMIEAIGLPRERLCTYCWTGECPKGNVITDLKAEGKGEEVPAEAITGVPR